MPDAGDEIRNEAIQTFGSADANDIIGWLEGRGYKLSKEFTWIRPENHTPAHDELLAISFLVIEWDFGGLERLNGPLDELALATAQEGASHDR